MSRLMRLLVAVVASTAVVSSAAGASVVAKAKKVSTDAYAKTLCRTYDKVVTDLNAFKAEIDSLEIIDNASFQTQVGTVGADLLADLDKSETKLKSVSPDIDDGKKVSKLFAKTTVDLQAALADALAAFGAADPSGVAFQADIAVLSAGVSSAEQTTLGAQLTGVTTQVTDQDLINSIGDEKTCHEIFPVTGG